MSGVLVIAETRRGELREVSLELIEAGRSVATELGCSLTVAVLDAAPERFIPALSCEGVDELLTVVSPFDHFDADIFESAAAALLAHCAPKVVVTGFTVDAMGWAPAVAAVHGLGFASDVTGLWVEDGHLIAQRELYAGKMVVELEFPGKRCVLTMIRPGTFTPASGGSSPATGAVGVDQPADSSRVEHLGLRETDVGDVDITRAEFLLSIGRGVGRQEDIEQFQQLATKLGATISVSRPLVDAGWVPSSRQVGQSGRTVKPRVYLALGISGAVQHLAGIREADTIIAVNTDPAAPIFGIAHYGAVADMFDVANELNRQF